MSDYNLKIELFTDEEIEKCINKDYYSCFEEDCDSCKSRFEIDNLKDNDGNKLKTCKTEIIGELWRKWKNACYERDSAIKDMTDYQGNICAYCKRFRTDECILSDPYMRHHIPLQCGKFEWRGLVKTCER